MTHNALDRIAIGNDKEYYILTGGSRRRLSALKSQITSTCVMPHTEALPTDSVRWQFPRYCLPVAAGAWYFDLADLFEVQTPECESPFRMVAVQNAMHEYIRQQLREANELHFGGCGYVRSLSPGSPLRFAGSHLNISFNAPGVEGCRTALQRDDARQAMLFFFSTSQVWGGIGLHFAPEWEVRARAVVADISNDCVTTKGVLQPGRPIPPNEVKEVECLHYTHYEAGWARSEYQRALSAAMVGIDAHLGCHHTTEVLQLLTERGVSVPPPRPWHSIRRALSGTFPNRTQDSISLGEQSFTLPQILELRLDMYDRLLPETADVEWVGWAIDQVACLAQALSAEGGEAKAPLLGLDSMAKQALVYTAFAESQGMQVEDLWEHGPAYETWLGRLGEPTDPAAVETLHDLLGLNLLYHDFSQTGLYEDLLETYPEFKRRQTLDQVAALNGDCLPDTRSRRRDALMQIYARLSEQSNGALTPCFSGFDRIAVQIRSGGRHSTQLHQLSDVLECHVTRADHAQVRSLARRAGVDAEPVLDEYFSRTVSPDLQPRLPELA